LDPVRFVHPASVSEEILWKGSPSQVLNLGKYAVALALAVGIGIGGMFFPPAWIALVLPLGWALWIFIETRATQENIKVEICANCHPMWTGKHKLMDTEGRVERFMNKYKKK
jgi:hypothetical protein